MSIPCWGCELPLPPGVTFCPRCGASLADDDGELDATRIGPPSAGTGPRGAVSGGSPGSLPPQAWPPAGSGSLPPHYPGSMPPQPPQPPQPPWSGSSPGSLPPHYPGSVPPAPWQQSPASLPPQPRATPAGQQVPFGPAEGTALHTMRPTAPQPQTARSYLSPPPDPRAQQQFAGDSLPLPPRKGPSTKVRTALALGIAFVVMVALGAVVGTFREPIVRVLGIGDLLNPPTTRAATAVPPSSAPPRSSASPSPSAGTSASATRSSQAPATTAAPSTSAPPPPPPTTVPPTTVKVFSVTVARTCGASGKGDCFLTERTQATGTSTAVKQWPEKSTLTVVCQVQGQSVSSTVLNRSSTVWSRTTTGGYVANIFLDGIDAFGITVPC